MENAEYTVFEPLDVKMFWGRTQTPDPPTNSRLQRSFSSLPQLKVGFAVSVFPKRKNYCRAGNGRENSFTSHPSRPHAIFTRLFSLLKFPLNQPAQNFSYSRRLL